MRALKSLQDLKHLGKLEEFVTGTKRLFEVKSVGLLHINPFIELAPLLESPRKLFNLFEDFASLASFRKQALPDVAEVIGKVARASGEGPRLAGEFTDDLAELAGRAKLRDKIDKTKRLADWSEAQKALDDAAETLKEKASKVYGLEAGYIRCSRGNVAFGAL